MYEFALNDIDYAVILWNVFSIDDESNRENMVTVYCKKMGLSKESANKMFDIVEAQIIENAPRIKFVTSFLHYNGENYGKLSDIQMWKAYCEADGFGYRTSEELREINGGWDWSHIRDSSYRGWKRMEVKINQLIM